MAKYSMGIDFGTLSGRAVLVDIETGAEIAESVAEYAHGVMSDRFINGEKLPADFALQHPQDYLDTLYFVIRDCIEKSGVAPEDIIGVGVDFTACTLLPVDETGTPLCFYEEFKADPHAYVKLWKHHAAQREADEINALAEKMQLPWLKQYGGTVSSEWLWPKVLEILRKDEVLYNRTHRFIEAGDWIVWKLTGRETHSVCAAGFKANRAEAGYPDAQFLGALDKRLETAVGTKISEENVKLSEVAGYITGEAEKLTGLKAGTPVCPAVIDAHAALPALGITHPGELLMIIGTSTCHIMLGDKAIPVPGISGFVKDGIVDGLYAYEAGQSCVGDSFDWFVKRCVPAEYYEEAAKNNMGIHKYLRSKAGPLGPGANGVMALDWWNGNRTPYVDGTLTGCLFGLGLNTRPEEIYRALVEATAYGTKRIIDIYEENGLQIQKLYAAGGIAEKDGMLMQIYADVLGKEIHLSGTPQACAHGSAVFGAVNQYGYATLEEAAENMKKIKDLSYRPDPENTRIYQKLYEEYKTLSDYFAKENRVLTRLREQTKK